MAEATAESPSTVLPGELMIEILFRVDLSNPLQLRCICKLWSSLILDPLFMKKHLHRSFTEIKDLHGKDKEHYNAFQSQLHAKYPITLQEQHDEAATAAEGKGKEENKDAEEEEDKEKHLLMKIVAELDDLVASKVSQLHNLDNIKVAQLEVEAIQLEEQAAQLEEQAAAQLDRVRCLKSFLQVYLKPPTSSSSQL